MLLRGGETVTPWELDLPLAVSPSMVSPTRRIIEAKLGPVLEDEDAIFRVAMTAHELLENAAKYASDGKARHQVGGGGRARGGRGARRVRAEGEMDIEVDVVGERVKIVTSGIVAR